PYPGLTSPPREGAKGTTSETDIVWDVDLPSFLAINQAFKEAQPRFQELIPLLDGQGQASVAGYVEEIESIGVRLSIPLAVSKESHLQQALAVVMGSTLHRIDDLIDKIASTVLEHGIDSGACEAFVQITGTFRDLLQNTRTVKSIMATIDPCEVHTNAARVREWERRAAAEKDLVTGGKKTGTHSKSVQQVQSSAHDVREDREPMREQMRSKRERGLVRGEDDRRVHSKSLQQLARLAPPDVATLAPREIEKRVRGVPAKHKVKTVERKRRAPEPHRPEVHKRPTDPPAVAPGTHQAPVTRKPQDTSVVTEGGTKPKVTGHAKGERGKVKKAGRQPVAVTGFGPQGGIQPPVLPQQTAGATSTTQAPPPGPCNVISANSREGKKGVERQERQVKRERRELKEKVKVERERQADIAPVKAEMQQVAAPPGGDTQPTVASHTSQAETSDGQQADVHHTLDSKFPDFNQLVQTVVGVNVRLDATIVRIGEEPFRSLGSDARKEIQEKLTTLEGLPLCLRFPLIVDPIYPAFQMGLVYSLVYETSVVALRTLTEITNICLPDKNATYFCSIVLQPMMRELMDNPTLVSCQEFIAQDRGVVSPKQLPFPKRMASLMVINDTISDVSTIIAGDSVLGQDAGFCEMVEELGNQADLLRTVFKYTGTRTPQQQEKIADGIASTLLDMTPLMDTILATYKEDARVFPLCHALFDPIYCMIQGDFSVVAYKAKAEIHAYPYPPNPAAFVSPVLDDTLEGVESSEEEGTLGYEAQVLHDFIGIQEILEAQEHANGALGGDPFTDIDEMTSDILRQAMEWQCEDLPPALYNYLERVRASLCDTILARHDYFLGHFDVREAEARLRANGYFSLIATSEALKRHRDHLLTADYVTPVHSAMGNNPTHSATQSKGRTATQSQRGVPEHTTVQPTATFQEAESETTAPPPQGPYIDPIFRQGGPAMQVWSTLTPAEKDRELQMMGTAHIDAYNKNTELASQAAPRDYTTLYALYESQNYHRTVCSSSRIPILTSLPEPEEPVAIPPPKNESQEQFIHRIRSAVAAGTGVAMHELKEAVLVMGPGYDSSLQQTHADAQARPKHSQAARTKTVATMAPVPRPVVSRRHQPAAQPARQQPVQVQSVTAVAVTVQTQAENTAAEEVLDFTEAVPAPAPARTQTAAGPARGASRQRAATVSSGRLGDMIEKLTTTRDSLVTDYIQKYPGAIPAAHLTRGVYSKMKLRVQKTEKICVDAHDLVDRAQPGTVKEELVELLAEVDGHRIRLKELAAQCEAGLPKRTKKNTKTKEKLKELTKRISQNRRQLVREEEADPLEYDIAEDSDEQRRIAWDRERQRQIEFARLGDDLFGEPTPHGTLFQTQQEPADSRRVTDPTWERQTNQTMGKRERERTGERERKAKRKPEGEPAANLEKVEREREPVADDTEETGPFCMNGPLMQQWFSLSPTEQAKEVQRLGNAHVETFNKLRDLASQSSPLELPELIPPPKKETQEQYIQRIRSAVEAGTDVSMQELQDAVILMGPGYDSSLQQTQTEAESEPNHPQPNQPEPAVSYSDSESSQPVAQAESPHPIPLETAAAAAEEVIDFTQPDPTSALASLGLMIKRLSTSRDPLLTDYIEKYPRGIPKAHLTRGVYSDMLLRVKETKKMCVDARALLDQLQPSTEREELSGLVTQVEWKQVFFKRYVRSGSMDLPTPSSVTCPDSRS
ncbi:hypothetical protein KIPB_001131, partial [Kipferlia bialata]